MSASLVRHCAAARRRAKSAHGIKGSTPQRFWAPPGEPAHTRAQATIRQSTAWARLFASPSRCSNRTYSNLLVRTLWCRGWDSNPYDRSPGILSPVRLPIPPPRRVISSIGWWRRAAQSGRRRCGLPDPMAGGAARTGLYSERRPDGCEGRAPDDAPPAVRLTPNAVGACRAQRRVHSFLPVSRGRHQVLQSAYAPYRPPSMAEGRVTA